MFRRVLRPLLALVLLALVLEGVLQVGALLLAWFGPGAAAPAARAGGATVLCVGDSFTFGLGAGALTGSYPAQLEGLLAERGHPGTRVVNCGWPGQNSVEVAGRLEQQLREHHPAVVCVLVGINDTWSRPGRVAEDGAAVVAPPGFRLEWRTLRLFKLVAGALRGAAATPALPGSGALVGSWRCGVATLRFASGGEARVNGAAWTWSAEGETLVLTPPAGPPLRSRWRLEGGRLALTQAGADLPQWFEPVAEDAASRPVPATPLARAQEALRSGTPEAAAPLFAQRVAADTHDLAAREGLLTALEQLGRKAEAAPHEAWLRAQARSDRAAFEALLRCVAARQDHAVTLATARELTAAFPDSGAGWLVLAVESFAANDRATASAAAERALALLPAAQDAERKELQRQRVAMIADESPEAALALVLRTFLADGDETQAISSLKLKHRQVGEAEFARALAQVGGDAATQARLQALWRKAQAREDDTLAALRHNLTRIVSQSRAAGAAVVVLSYPFLRADIEAVQREVAQATGAGYVATRPEFERLLTTRPRNELFIPDGHCTSAGYGVMARLVVGEVARRL